MIDALDRMDELSKEELTERLGNFRNSIYEQGKEEAQWRRVLSMQQEKMATAAGRGVWRLGLVDSLLRGGSESTFTALSAAQAGGHRRSTTSRRSLSTFPAGRWKMPSRRRASSFLKGTRSTRPWTSGSCEGTRITIRGGRGSPCMVDGKRMSSSSPTATGKGRPGPGRGPHGLHGPRRPGAGDPPGRGMEIRVIRVDPRGDRRDEKPFPSAPCAGPSRTWPRAKNGSCARARKAFSRPGFSSPMKTASWPIAKSSRRRSSKSPSPEIIGEGTREAHAVFETATGTYRYVDVLDMEATAYYPGPESTGPMGGRLHLYGPPGGQRRRRRRSSRHPFGDSAVRAWLRRGHCGRYRRGDQGLPDRPGL